MQNVRRISPDDTVDVPYMEQFCFNKTFQLHEIILPFFCRWLTQTEYSNCHQQRLFNGILWLYFILITVSIVETLVHLSKGTKVLYTCLIGVGFYGYAFMWFLNFILNSQFYLYYSYITEGKVFVNCTYYHKQKTLSTSYWYYGFQYCYIFHINKCHSFSV